MEVLASGHPIEGPAQALLIEQRRLVRLQVISERAGLALKLLTVAAGLAIASVLGLMVWQAAHDHSIVVRAFSVPPSYEARGMSGEVLASKVIDKLNVIRRQTQSASIGVGPNVRAATEDVRVEIPQTGISFTELQRLLAQQFGDQKIIQGALTEGPAGELKLTVRVGDQAREVSGSGADMDSLIEAAAEQAFAAQSPDQWAIYLGSRGQFEEGVAAAKANALGRGGKGAMGAAAYSIWAGREGDLAKQLHLLQRATAIAPDLLPPQRNLARAYLAYGDEQRAWMTARAAANMQGGAESVAIVPDAVRRLHRDARFVAAVTSGDYSLAMANAPPGSAAIAAARAHDDAAAKRLLADGLEDEQVAPDEAAMVRVVMAEAQGDWPTMRQRMSEYEGLREAKFNAPAGVGLPARSASPNQQAAFAGLRTRRDAPMLARALANSGAIDEARAVAATTPLDCAPCLRARAEVESAAGQWKAADDWYARAAAMTPDLPMADYLWGASLLARGDKAGAAAKLTSAMKRGPRFAEPRELMGELLLAQKQYGPANAQFRAAAKFAPRWGRLQLKWGEALAGQGKADEARARWRAALGMSLSPADRTALTAKLAR